MPLAWLRVTTPALKGLSPVGTTIFWSIFTIQGTHTTYGLWRVNGCQQGFRFVANFGFGGLESASKPPQAICKPLCAMKKMKSLFNVLIIATLFSAFAQKNDDEVEFVTNEKLEKQLNIPKLKTSDNDIDLRIFFGRGFTNGGLVLWIKKKKDSE
ncbi:hypothetical protein V8V91_25815 [Algoriphagus halophilus]|uniref:hypothetical protein n=1 Tax=Algoriphagus halophilus TaxID=226505 RepID=UPI00358F537F